MSALTASDSVNQMKRLWVITCLLLFAASLARADFVIYRQDFNGSADGTPLTDLPGWYTVGVMAPLITDGKARVQSPGSWCDMLFDMTDIFSYGNTQARIEFDVVGGSECDIFFAPGTASVLDFNYNEFFGWEQGPYNGANLLFTSANGRGWDQSTQNWANESVLPEYHYVINLIKTDTTLTWSATYGGHTLIGGNKSPLSFTLTDQRGLNTMEWHAKWWGNYPDTANPAMSTMDNLVITAIGVAKPRQATVIIVR
jgi:hypothetical protein